jgi:hypothetical protein
MCQESWPVVGTDDFNSNGALPSTVSNCINSTLPYVFLVVCESQNCIALLNVSVFTGSN